MHFPRSLLVYVVLVLVGFAACGDNGAEGPPPPADASVPDASPAVLQSIAITPTVPSIAAGTTVQLTATGTYSDATTKSLSDSVTWTSSDMSVAKLDATGLLTGLVKGTATITATVDGVTGTTTAMVTDATLTAIQVTPTNPIVAAGTTIQLTATGVFSDGSHQDLTTQVTWELDEMTCVTSGSENDHCVEMDATGLVTAVATGQGTANVTATLGTISGSTTVVTSGAVLVSIAITPPAPHVALGRTLALTAMGTFSDHSTQDLTSQVTWSSATEEVVTVDPAGLASTHATGTSTITAKLDAISGTTELTVTDAVLVSIGVTPSTPTVAAGLTQQFTATGTYSDHSTQDLTTQVAWSSEHADVAEVSNAAESQGLATTKIAGTTVVTATLVTLGGTIVGATTLTVTDAVVRSIQLSPTDPSAAAGTRVAFVATGIYSDNSHQTITTQVTWESSNTAVAEISNAADEAGLATTKIPGTTTIRATMPGVIGVTGETVLTVTDAVLVAIEVTPTRPSLPAGRTLQFTATGRFSDASVRPVTGEVTWETSDVAIATISNDPESRGVVSGVKAGPVAITATRGAISGTTDLTVSAAALVSIGVTPSAPTVAAGLTQQFEATGTYSDHSTQDITTQVAWSSEHAAVADVSNAAESKGQATTKSVGTTVVTATLEGITGTATLTVTDAVLQAIQLSPVDPSVAAGTPVGFVATGIYSDSSHQTITARVTWASSNTAVATISSAADDAGLATTRIPGTTTISATMPGVTGVTGETLLTVTNAVLVAIEVTPTRPSLPAGRTLPFTATGRYSDASTRSVTADVTWDTSDVAIATISNDPASKGVASGVKVGVVTISATQGAISGRTELTVSAAELVSIGVTPSAPTVAAGLTQPFEATGTYSDHSTQDLTTQVAWSSEHEDVADVSNAAASKGLATAKIVGTTVVTASFGEMAGTATLTVTDAVVQSIHLSPIDPSVAAGARVAFVATGIFSDHSNQTLTTQVTWASSNTAVAAISNVADDAGLATTRIPGTTTISATFGGVTGETLLAVTDAVLVAIEVTPAHPSLAAGRTLQLTATGRYSDDSTRPVTAEVTWTTSASAIATISNAPESKGVVSGVTVGTVTVTATDGTIETTTELTVTTAELVSIAVTPAIPSVAAGIDQQFVATGTFSDHSTQDLTTQVTWASANPAVAEVSNAAASKGLATTKIAGTTVVTATSGVISGETTLTVTAAILRAIQVTPVNQTIPAGTRLAFHATGLFSDSSTEDLTGQATWVSSTPDVVEISNAADAGVASGRAPGLATISATFRGVTGASQLTVSEAVLVSLEVTPAAPSLPAGLNLPFTALGTFSDASRRDMTTEVVWDSSAPAIATISNAPGGNGVARGLAAGSTEITATSGDVTATSRLTVTAALLRQIIVAPATPSIARGRRVQLTAIGTFSDGSAQDLTPVVTWTAADPAIVAISSDPAVAGLATGLATGATVVTATFGIVAASTTITVTNAVLDSILVAPATASVIPSATQPYTAVGRFSDGTSNDLTRTATWASADEAIARVSNADPTQGQVTGVAVGSTTITATSDGVTGSALIVVTGPGVASTLPRNGAFGIRASTPVVVTFDQAITPASLVTQTTAGACTGTLQLSSDDFATCVGFTSAAPTLATGNLTATAQPSAALSSAATYRIRVLGTVTNAAGGAGVSFTQAAGFGTASAGSCPGRLVISQVYGAGGIAGSPTFHSDFIELHNGGGTPVSLAGFAVQFAAATGATLWQVTALPAVDIPAGGYFLIKEADGGTVAPALPTPDVIGVIPMGSAAGKVALTASTVPLTGACPFGLTNDLVGYGVTGTGAPNCTEGTAPTGGLGAQTAAVRNLAGCTDADDNKNDFALAVPTPRNGSFAPRVCECPPAETAAE